MNNSQLVKQLPKLMQDAISALAQLHNIPLEIALPATLGVVNLACQSRYNVDSGVYGVRPLSLNLIAIAPTGALKSTSYGDLMPGVTRYIDQERIKSPAAKEKFDLETALYKKAKDKYVKDVSAHGTSAGFLVPVEPTPAQTCKINISKGTVNGILNTLKAQPMVGVFSAEGGEFFNGHAFQKNGAGQSAAIEMAACLTSMWDGSTIEKLTGIEGFELRNRRVCMFMMLQEKTIRDFLNNETFADQGFTHRLLISMAGEHDKKIMDVSPAAKLKTKQIQLSLTDFHNRIFNILDNPFAFSVAGNYELDLPTISMSTTAEQRLCDYYNSYVNTPMFADPKWAGFANRAHEMPLRIAANLAVFENKKFIDLAEMECAIAIYEFYIDQRKQLQLDFTPTNAEKVKASDAMIRWMKEKKFDDTLRTLREYAPNNFKKLDAVQRAAIIDEMVTSGDVEIYAYVNTNNRTIQKIRVVDMD